MAASVRAAVKACDRAVIAVEPHGQSIGARRSPGLQHALLTDPALLCWLLRRVARAEAWSDPIVWINFVQHPAAIALSLNTNSTSWLRGANSASQIALSALRDRRLG